MKTFFQLIPFFALLSSSTFLAVALNPEGTTVWQVTKFDVTANVQQALYRTLNATATISAINVGTASGSTFTVVSIPKQALKLHRLRVSAPLRNAAETRGDLQRVVVTLPTQSHRMVLQALPSTTYCRLRSTRLSAISPISSQFLPLSFWYPMPSTAFTLRGAGTAPFTLTVNLPNVVSSEWRKLLGIRHIVRTATLRSTFLRAGRLGKR